MRLFKSLFIIFILYFSIMGQTILLTSRSDVIDISPLNISNVMSRQDLLSTPTPVFSIIPTSISAPYIVAGGNIRLFGGDDNVNIDLNNREINGRISLGGGNDSLTLKDVVFTPPPAGFFSVDGQNGNNNPNLGNDTLNLEGNITADSFVNFTSISKSGDGDLRFNELRNIDQINFSGGKVYVDSSSMNLEGNLTVNNSQLIFANNAKLMFNPAIKDNFVILGAGSRVQIKFENDLVIDIGGTLNIDQFFTLEIRNIDDLPDDTYSIARFGKLVGDPSQITVVNPISGMPLSRVQYSILEGENNELRLMVQKDRTISDFLDTVVVAPTANQRTILKILDGLETAGFSAAEEQALQQITQTSNNSVNNAIIAIASEAHTTIIPTINAINTDFNAKVLKRNTDRLSFDLLNPFGPYNQLGINKFWSDVSSDSGNRKGNGTGFDYDSYSVRVGYERKFEEIFFGVSVAYSDTSVDLSNNLGDMDVDSLSFGVYGYKSHRSGSYSIVSLTYTNNEIDLRRNVGGLPIEGSTNGYAADLSYAYSYQVHSNNNSHLLSVVGVSYNNSGFDDFTESGTFSATTVGEDVYLLTSRVGVVYQINILEGSLTSSVMKLNADWLFNVLDTERDVVSQLNTGDNNFNVNGIDDKRSLFNVGINWEKSSGKYIYSVGYGLSFNNIVNNHSFTARVDYHF